MTSGCFPTYDKYPPYLWMLFQLSRGLRLGTKVQLVPLGPMVPRLAPSSRSISPNMSLLLFEKRYLGKLPINKQSGGAREAVTFVGVCGHPQKCR
jgi:hypothetical protein